MANKVFRQTLSTGVALASAGAIALTPVTVAPEVTAVLEAPRVLSAEVLPTGLVQDLQLVASGAQAALGQSYDALTRKIPDLWWTVHEHWPDADLLHWNYALVSGIFLAPITPLVIGPLNDAVAEAVARNFPVLGDQIRQIPELVEYAFVRLVGPLLSAIGGAGVAHSEIFYSMTTLRIEPFIEAIVRAPFHVIDGLLFGGYGDLAPILPGREGEYIPAPGLLTPWGQPPAVRDIKTPDDIVDTAVPDENATLVSVTTDTEADTEQTADDLAPHAEVTPGTAPGAEVVPAVEVTEEPEVVETVKPEVTEPEVTEAAIDDATESELVESDDADTDEAVTTKPAEKDPANRIQQGVKDFRDNVGRTVQKLTGGGSTSRDSGEGAGSDRTTTSGSGAAQ
ncbi:hypothetical protein [Mycolicibacterium bacteremicum]|uniref:hypothetical protein n=1 Tax=Mycolicibacterium bacteremicum TaxID=564198 RepID=UPI0026EC4420|nr:hypothetical protein [Mycolicibacterium bacteremicum]